MIVCRAGCRAAFGIPLTLDIREQYPPELQAEWKVLDKWFATVSKAPTMPLNVLVAYRRLQNAHVPGTFLSSGNRLCPIISWREAEIFTIGVAIPNDVYNKYSVEMKAAWRKVTQWWGDAVSLEENLYLSKMPPEIKTAYEAVLNTPLPDTDGLVLGRDTYSMKLLQGQILNC